MRPDAPKLLFPSLGMPKFATDNDQQMVADINVNLCEFTVPSGKLT